ncbi:two-component system, response regulator YesN [Paenibacillus sp. UNCCL117]|uniref:response regulator n=1 Tax=unclassified Paenibacillus TaxID=185978 RepID=UPI0008925514|nr:MULTISPECIES: response regulator [unclassified Paenibacillus]SDC54851.1 two component transcriptional regulator, AraC family [Paenibacillus sp. cl123]SFW11001.1 two-component system, response regulator YesN [Paenibacillus sp. UNCCL117]
MRILLVEDEPLFRKGLAKMIAGSEASWDVCGEAENGQEAEQLIAELQPDLIVTDIRMPVMDGLELLQRTKAAFPDIEFIVITGFQDFQYAQAALRSGALDLLVKPCSKQDMHDALTKADIFVQKKRTAARKKASERQLLQENALRAIFLRFPYRPEAAAELEQKLRSTKLIVLHVADFLPPERSYTKRDVPLLQFAVLNIMGELLDAHRSWSMLLLIEAGRFALLLPPGAEAEVQRLLDAACTTVRQLLGLTVAAHEAGVVSSLGGLADMYEAALANSAQSRASRDRDEQPEAALPVNRVRQQLIGAQAAAFIMAGQAEALQQYLDGLMKEMSALDAEALPIEALSLSFALQDAARKQLERESDARSLSERIGKLNECRSKDEVCAWMKAETERFMRHYEEWQSRYSSNAVSRAIRYIEEHYAEQLSLQQVASHVHLNAAYFSHLFKKETGRSFVNFLIDVRMDKAKLLLSNTNLNVTEVSGKVGYDLPNYFAKLFKINTGLTPKEYRKHHMI